MPEAEVLQRRPAPDPVAARARSPVVLGAVAAAWAAAVGIAACVLLVLAVWALAPHDGSTPVDAVRVGALSWLAAHHVEVTVGDAPLSLVPLGLTLLPVLALYRAGRWAGRVSAEALPAAAAATLTLAAAYGIAAAVLASATEDAHSAARPAQALVAAAAFGLVAGGCGVLSGSGLWADAYARLPEPVEPVLRGAVAGVAALLGGAALVLGVALAWHGAEVAHLSGALGGGVAGVVALLVLGLLALPTAVVWTAAFAVGPGFAVGVGTAVAPAGVSLGPVPAFPLLGALPATGPAPGISLLALAVPVVAGVVVGLLAARRPAPATHEGRTTASAGRTAAEALAAGAVAGVLLAVLTWLSAGSLGPVRMSDLGPAPLAVGAAAALELGAVGALVAFEGTRHRVLLHRWASWARGQRGRFTGALRKLRPDR
jgi:hypothetical protein